MLYKFERKVNPHGYFKSVSGNAANTVVFPLTVVALAIAVMIGDGCCAFVSISLGKGERSQAKRSIFIFVFRWGMMDAAASTALSMIREVVFGVGFALLLPVFFGLNGVLLSLPVFWLPHFLPEILGQPMRTISGRYRERSFSGWPEKDPA